MFLQNLDNNVLIKLHAEISTENLSNFEKILEGIFIRFEELSKYKPAIFGPKKTIIIVVIPIFEHALKRLDMVENFKKSIYFMKFFFILF